MRIATSDHDGLARLFARIASEAGQVVMDIRDSAHGPRTRRKENGSPVSDADEAAEDLILTCLGQHLPAVPIMGEEKVAREGFPDSGDQMILVDALDGTREFLRGSDEFTVNIALITGGRPVLGCVYAPARGEMFVSGQQGRAGLHVRLAPGDDPERAGHVPLPSGNTEPDTMGIRAIVSNSHLDSRTSDFLRIHAITDISRCGSSLKFCRLATGHADIYPRFGPTMEWDTAAGQAVLEGSGGRVLTLGGSDHIYGKRADTYRNGPFIAWSKDGFAAHGHRIQADDMACQ